MKMANKDLRITIIQVWPGLIKKIKSETNLAKCLLGVFQVKPHQKVSHSEALALNLAFLVN